MAGANVNTIIPGKGTALHAAAGCGHVAVITQLVNSRAIIDATTSTGDTPLHVAACQGHRAVVTKLLHWVGQSSLTGVHFFCVFVTLNPYSLHIML